MANGHGGRRPGAGQKKKTTEEQQATNRDLVLSLVSVEALTAMTQTAMSQAEQGDPAARNWVSSYVLGNPKNEHDVTVKGGVTIMLPERKKADAVE